MIKNLLFYLGGVLLCLGALMPLFLPGAAPYVFTLGALLFAPIQIADRYEGRSIVIRHLRRQQIVGALLLVVTGMMMLCSLYRVPPFRGTEWKLALAIAVVLELYTIFRIDHEEKKEKK